MASNLVWVVISKSCRRPAILYMRNRMTEKDFKLGTWPHFCRTRSIHKMGQNLQDGRVWHHNRMPIPFVSAVMSHIKSTQLQPQKLHLPCCRFWSLADAHVLDSQWEFKGQKSRYVSVEFRFNYRTIYFSEELYNSVVRYFGGFISWFVFKFSCNICV